MEFKISLDWGKKKSIENTFNNTTPPELWGNSYFYNLQTITQNSKALIDMYNELPEVSAPVNYIVDKLSTIPYKHVTKRGDQEIEVMNSPYMRILENPNQYQTENDYIKTYFINRIVLGAGYVNYVKAMGFDNFGQLFILPTENTEPVLRTKDRDYRLNEVIEYETSFGGHVLTLPKDEVFVNKEATIGTESYFEIRSRLMAAISTSESLRNNYQARISLINDRGSTGIISPNEQGAVISPSDAETMRNKYYAENGITKGKFPFLISPRGMNFTSTSMNAGELELIPNKIQDFTIVCNVLGIEPSLMGLGNNTYNNKKLAKTSLYEDVVIPYFQNYLQFTKTILGLPDNDYFKADYSQISAMQEDYDKIVQSNSKAWNDGVITESEYREAIGREGGSDSKKPNTESNQGAQGANQE